MEPKLTLIRETSIFEKNMGVIASRDPDLALRIATAPDDDKLLTEITKSRNGDSNLAVRRGEKLLHLHSRYDPQKEASDLVDGAFDERRNYYIVFGFGLGYALEELERRTISGDLIFVIDPDIAVFKRILHERDLTNILKNEKLSWSIGEPPETAFARWARTYNISRMDGLGMIEMPYASKLVGNDYMKRFNTQLKGLIVTAGGNLQTLMLMAKQYQANTLFNLRYVLTNPPLKELFGAFSGKPAIIVSAGPSLDKNIDLLREVRDRSLIIAVDTSLKPLKAKGIEPHLVCTGDPQEANYRHLKGAAETGAYLVAEPMTNPKSFADFNGQLFATSYGDKLIGWIESHIHELGHVQCWGSVATMAFDTARKLGCDPIIFVGQDLSFPDGRTYAKGTYFETEEKRQMTVEAQERNGVYNVEDIFGNTITTNRQMFAYHRWFVVEVARTKAKVINATEGGILKEGVEIIPLRDAIDKYCVANFDAASIIGNIASAWKKSDAVALLANLDAVTKDLYEMRRIARECFELSITWLKNSNNFDTLPKNIATENMSFLEQNRKKMIAKRPAFLFLEMADQKAVKIFLTGYRRINGKKMGLAAYRDVLDIYAKFYSSISDTLNYMIPHFETAKITVRQHNTSIGAVENNS